MEERESRRGYLMFRGAEWLGLAALAVSAFGASLLVVNAAVGYVVLGIGGVALLVAAAGGGERRRSKGTRATAELLLFVGWAAWLVMIAATPWAVRPIENGEPGAFEPGPGLVAGWIVAPLLFLTGMNLRVRWPVRRLVVAWAALLLPFALTLVLVRLW